MSIDIEIVSENPCLRDWSILTAYRGSISHGMYVPCSDPMSTDDKDAIAICVPPVDYYYGMKQFGSRGTQEIKRGVWDIVVYELTKAIRMLAQGNPNILAILWLDKKFYMEVTPAGQLLLDYRHLFVGKHVYRSFIGYARGQLHRMTHTPCQGYMGAKRKQLVQKFGYDTKNAAHLIRLLRMGIEFLSTGELQVFRQDAQELLAIKLGQWSLEAVKIEAERLFVLAHLALVRSSLPDCPDLDKINDLCIAVARKASRDAAL